MPHTKKERLLRERGQGIIRIKYFTKNLQWMEEVWRFFNSPWMPELINSRILQEHPHFVEKDPQWFYADSVDSPYIHNRSAEYKRPER